MLDRLIVATQLRYPSVGDVARAVRFRYFEKPVVQQARQEVVDEAERLLAELAAAARAGGPEDMERVEALVASPEPLIRLLAERLDAPRDRRPDPILEVLTRRYYRRREPGEPAVLPARRAHLRHRRLRAAAAQRLHLVALMAPQDDLPAALAAVGRRLVAETADPSDVVVDLYVVLAGPAGRRRRAGGRLRGQLAGLDGAAVGPPGDGHGLHPGRRRRDADLPAVGGRPGLAEEAVIRGMHPLTAQRLDLWRLKNFDGERLPSAEDTYLLHVVGEGEPERRAAHRHGGGPRRDAAARTRPVRSSASRRSSGS